jgi:inosine-uridine nucleoside N-ribohydrolase
MLEILMLAVGGVATVAGYIKSRQFVRQRLRFVDAVQKPVAPLAAGAVAAVVAAPVVWLLPVLGAGTALVFGAGVGVGVLHGARDVNRLPPAY